MSIFCDYEMQELVESGCIILETPLDDNQIQPTSMDLRLGEEVYRVHAAFLPQRNEPVAKYVQEHAWEKRDLSKGDVVLEEGVPYIIKLQERCALPAHVAGKVNPKSSSGRIDLFVRLVADGVPQFDTVPYGYHGELYALVVPLSFPIIPHVGNTLNQIRFFDIDPRVSHEGIKVKQKKYPLIYKKDGRPISDIESYLTEKGLVLHADLENEIMGYCAKQDTPPINLNDVCGHNPHEYWERITGKKGKGLVIHRGRFYLLSTLERISISDDMAAEIAPYDVAFGDFRTHYAGFIDAGFGWSRDDSIRGREITLEVRESQSSFRISHNQPMCCVSIEQAHRPHRVYGETGSHYAQQQGVTLGKYFKPWESNT